MPDQLTQIETLLTDALAEISTLGSIADLELFRIKYLGAKGSVKELMTLLAKVPREQKPAVGQRVNAVKQQITAAFDEKKASLQTSQPTSEDIQDVTEPGRPLRVGSRHILMTVIAELTELFGRMGFSVASGPEVEDEFHNFVALNIPESHPARDPLDNFYLQGAGEGSGFRVGEGSGFRVQGSAKDQNSGAPDTPSSLNPEPRALNPLQLLLRTQTSTVQIRVLETQKPPIRVVIPGRVYRPDTTDQTHLPMFHQLEALVVDQSATMVDLKSTVTQFVRAYFGSDTRMRFRPSFFPFTEPSAEVDVWFEDRGKWIELGGCGMVHPNVLKNVGLDPDIYSGWAFGFGVERIAMRKYGISDIRQFVENDLRFLTQF